MSDTPMATRLAALTSAAELSAEATNHPEAPRVLQEIERIQALVSTAQTTLIVGVGGPSGTGRSSLLNALLEQKVAEVSLVRPTTTRPTAYAVGTAAEVAAAHLSDIPFLPVPGDVCEGLVLIDLPGGSSTDQLDLILWVTSPETYADTCALRRLDALVESGAPVQVILTRSDTVREESATAIALHLQHLVRAGIPLPRVVSSRTGAGITDLRMSLDDIRAANRRAIPGLSFQLSTAATRLRPALLPVLDGATVGRRISQLLPTSPVHQLLIERLDVEQLAADLADRRANAIARATAWPLLRWRSIVPTSGEQQTEDVPDSDQADEVALALRTYAEELVKPLDDQPISDPWAQALTTRIVSGAEAVRAAAAAVQREQQDRSAVRPTWSLRVRRLQGLLLFGFVVAAGLAGWGLVARDARIDIAGFLFEAPPLVPTLAVAALCLLTGVLLHITGRSMALEASRWYATVVTEKMWHTIVEETDAVLQEATTEVLSTRQEVRLLLRQATE